MEIALLGLGTVGSAVARLLEQNRSDIEAKAGGPIHIRWALVRTADRPRSVPEDVRVVTDPARILEDPEVEMVIEVMGGEEPAFELMRSALLRGKTVVTANKDVVAAHGEALEQAASATEAEIYYEGAVGGGIPIVRSLQMSLSANRIERVYGVLNGTTNFILTRMEESGWSYADALAEAQRQGYAEADPAADVDGVDAARKIAILSGIAFNRRVHPGDVRTEGIRSVTAADIRHARGFHWRIRLLAAAVRRDERLEIAVGPTLIPDRHPLAAVRDAMNAVYVVGDALGEAMFYGAGAGGDPTASAVVGDLVEAARNRRLGARRLRTGPMPPVALVPADRSVAPHYLRLRVSDRPGMLARLTGVLAEAEVSANWVVQEPESPDFAEVVIVTHEASEAQIAVALERMARERGVEVGCHLRVLAVPVTR